VRGGLGREEGRKEGRKEQREWGNGGMEEREKELYSFTFPSFLSFGVVVLLLLQTERVCVRVCVVFPLLLLSRQPPPPPSAEGRKEGKQERGIVTANLSREN